MAFEIERKFLMANDSWRADVSEAFNITQGYLSRDPQRTVRIRRKGDEAYLTIKGQPVNTNGVPVVPEFEYSIPVADADTLMTLCLPGAIVKTRHIVMHDENRWEIDVFAGDNSGLIMAEIELTSADQNIALPDWAGQEVTADRRYANAALAEKPFKTWDKAVGPKTPGR